MEAGPWRGVKDAILRLWTRRDTRDPGDCSQDEAKEGESSAALEAVTAGQEGGAGGRDLGLATVSQTNVSPIAVPAPPTLAAHTSGRMVSSPRSRTRQEALLEEEVELALGDKDKDDGNMCKAQEQLDMLIRNRGYHVREHIPRRVLEEQVMENIRRRERIARILRQEEPESTSPLRSALKEPQQPPPQPQLPMAELTERTAEINNLLTKVWTDKGATVTGRGVGEMDWARSQFVQECVREHNMLRSLHSAQPLVLSEQLCKDAQEWANRLAHFQLLEYSTEHGRGENILTTTSKVNITGKAVARAWYETGRTFKFGITGAADLAHAGPFSQVVWESTKYVGIGVARGTDGRSVVVARYYPPGNVAGQFSANVKASTSNRTLPRQPTNVSRTRQEAQFYVRIALEPPGKIKKTDRMSMMLKFPSRVLDEDALSPDALLTQATTIESLSAKSPIRNGAARTSKLFPICCVTPAKTEERWAQPSARSQQQQQPQQLQPSSQHLGDELSPRHASRTSTLRAEEQLESIHGSPAEDRSHRHLSTSPLIKTRSPRRCSSPKALPRLARAARKANSPRRGASPKPSPRKGATSRLRALAGQGEHGVVIATL